MKTNVSLIRCTSYETAAVEPAVRRAIDLIGGIRTLVKPGERILIKPNLLSARQPERGVTTHPAVVRAVVRLVKEAGCQVFLGDSPGGAVKGVERVWTETGMKKIAEEEGVTLVNFETAGAQEMKINHPHLKSVHISRAVIDIDGIINLPKLKTHGLLVYTGGVKNFYGIVPGLRKAEYHKLVPDPADFARLIAQIYMLVKNKVRFTLIDGIIGMEGNGPASGDLRQLDMILASTDAVALDTAATSLLGIKPGQTKNIVYLADPAAGVNTLADINITGDNASLFSLANFRFPATWYLTLIPKPLIRLLARHFWIKPTINAEKCRNCRICVESCPVKTIASESGKKPRVIKEHCISCLCCHELCPYDAIDLTASPLMRIIRRRDFK